jgi:ribosomal protein S6
MTLQIVFINDIIYFVSLLHLLGWSRIDRREVKSVNAYECMFIVDAQVEDEQFDILVTKFENIVTEGNGEISKTDKLGRRRLAYEIKDRTEGNYVDLYFNATGEVVKELERVFKITDGILRYMIVRKDK